jgi:hypothetical protein
MKLHELSEGTRFAFPGKDATYRVVYKGKDAVHFTGPDGNTWIVIKSYDKSWNAEVEMA